MTARCVLWAHKLRLYSLNTMTDSTWLDSYLALRGLPSLPQHEELMEKQKDGTYGTRPRNLYIKVFVTPEEMSEIQEKAKISGLSLSAFLRAVALNQKIRSVLDFQAVVNIVKVSGDMGRVAGLLKLWLAEKRGQGAQPIVVESLISDFRLLQKQMRDLMSKGVNGR